MDVDPPALKKTYRSKPAPIPLTKEEIDHGLDGMINKVTQIYLDTQEQGAADSVNPNFTVDPTLNDLNVKQRATTKMAALFHRGLTKEIWQGIVDLYNDEESWESLLSVHGTQNLHT